MRRASKFANSIALTGAVRILKSRLTAPTGMGMFRRFSGLATKLPLLAKPVLPAVAGALSRNVPVD